MMRRRGLLFGFFGLATLTILTSPDTARARVNDYPHSGYCARNLLHVRHLRACSWFDAQGHRISPAEHWARIRKFLLYGIADWR